MAGGVVLGISLRFHNHAPQQFTIRLAFHQQATNGLGGNLLRGAGKEGLGEAMGGSGGYGSSCVKLSEGILTTEAGSAKLGKITSLRAMSPEQLVALLSKLKEDAGVHQEKLRGATDLDAAVTWAKDAGFDVSKADLLKYQAPVTLGLSDEAVAMGCLSGVLLERLQG